jgi:hypothetical protein
MSVNMRVEGLDGVLTKLQKVGTDADRVASKTVQRTLIDIHRDARKAAPVNDGRIRASLAWTFLNPEETEGEVGTNVAYAPFVEFGVGPTGADSDFTLLAEQAMRELGYQHGPHGPFPPEEEIARWAHKHNIPEDAVPAIQFIIWRYGIEAQPFIFPAAEFHGAGFIPALSRALDRVIAQAAD